MKARHKDVFDFYRGLIALRKAHLAFRLTEKAAVDQALEFATNLPANVVAYVIKDHANGDSWRNILVIYNGTAQKQDVKVAGDWTIVANDKQAGIDGLQTVKGKITSEPFSLVVAHTEGTFSFNLKH